jgi:hypothetical protein
MIKSDARSMLFNKKMLGVILPACTIRTILSVFLVGLICLPAAGTSAWAKKKILPDDVRPVLEYLLDLAKARDQNGFDAKRIGPLLTFVSADQPKGTTYHAGGDFGAPSAYHDYTACTDLKHLMGYLLSTDIPSFFLWPSSIRLSRWIRVDGGHAQLGHLRAAAGLKEPFLLRGTEHVTITPDQHTGAYYSYDSDKSIILTPYRKGMALISVSMQQQPSTVGKKGWVLGEDEDWSYLYTEDSGLNVGGLGWVKTYMYDSFGISVYYQPDLKTPVVSCGMISWIKAGWAGINMVQSKHIHRGLVRVAKALTVVLENPRLPDPTVLAKTFADAKDLPTATLKNFGKDYFNGLGQRVAASESLSKKLRDAFHSKDILDRMGREELYAALALDYFKKILGRNPVMQSHPF